MKFIHCLVLVASTALADDWAGFDAHHPGKNVGTTNDFASLRSEVIAQRLRVFFKGPSKQPISLVSSADAPGHWPARDWHSIPMRATATGWDATVPVEDLDVPIIYYLAIGTNNSPMRMIHPRAAGLEEPTRIFWPFVDGFEDPLAGWRGTDASVDRNTNAHTGKQALSVSILKRSGTVSTTRVRGWQAHGQRALGLRLWARKRQGTGRIRVSLLAHAFTDKQVVATFPVETTAGPDWEKIDLVFASLPAFPLALLDLISIEFIGPGEYLLDDVELLGPWPSETR